MLQDILVIPHEIFDIPIFGPGWLLMAWVLFSTCLLGWLVAHHGWGAETRSYLPVIAVVTAVIWFILPRLEQFGPQGEPLGLPIRGYGLMLLFAMVAAVLLAIYEARRMGLDSELILALAFYVFIGGIIGARLFFVIEYWEQQFQRDSVLETIGAILNVTQGGLVVYGSLIGATVAALWFLLRRGLPVLAIADLVSPSLILGLAIGRIGCLMNGCCYGSVCEDSWFGVSFPFNSPPYIHQRQSGQLYGFRIESRPGSGEVIVGDVSPDSPAAAAGLVEGVTILSINGIPTPTKERAAETLFRTETNVELYDGSRVYSMTLKQLPARSRPVHPTQIYSTINAGLLCLVLWAWYPFRRRDGEVFALLMTVYPVTRILIELIRTDEPSQFHTQLTISQLISIAILVSVIGFWAYLLKQPRGSVLPFRVGDNQPKGATGP